MDIKQELIANDANRESRMHGIFASLFIFENRLQTLFDNFDTNITLKQLMLLIAIKLSEPNETFTNYGKMLGCSRQNIKKLMTSLDKNNFIEVKDDEDDKRKKYIQLTQKTQDYFSGNLNVHSQKLNLLFENFSDDEITVLYSMFKKLYDGIERLENA